MALKDFRPILVGATAVTMTVGNALAVLRAVKKINPRIPTVMGGPHVTFTARDTLQAHPELDIAVLGEGERTIVELTQAFAAGTDIESVPGIAYRHDSGIHVTPSRPFIRNLDGLPSPARHLLPLGRYRALRMPISMTTSRGCPFKCIFCVGRRMVGAKVRYRSPGSVVDELASLAEMNFHQINLADDLFTANTPHCMAVCDEIEKRGLVFKWTSFARVDTVNTELLRRMRSAGCTAVSFGIESADPQILKAVKKGITLDQVMAAVEMCNQADISPCASFILGLPGETEESIELTLRFGEKLKEMGLMYGFHLLAPFPGTEIRQRHKAYGIRILSHDWSDYHANRAIVETEGVSQWRLNELVISWEDQFNSHLADIGNRMAKGTASQEEADQLIGLERTVMLYKLMMEGIIEAHGNWRQNDRPTNETAALQELTDRIAAACRLDRAKLADAMTNAVGLDCLIRGQEGDLVRWKWRDYL